MSAVRPIPTLGPLGCPHVGRHQFGDVLQLLGGAELDEFAAGVDYRDVPGWQ